jgi:cyclohexanone monooxygenase
VDDPDTAEALKPYYRFMCKRPTSSEQYLATFNRPNVTLVDVSACKGVERLTEKGIVADGVEYEVDCVIFASGFEISTEISRRYAIDRIVGRDGLSLFDYWQDDYKTLHGMTSRGFPNQFFMGFIQGGVSANTTAMFEQQAEHIAYIIAEAQNRGAKTVEPTQEGQDAWVQTVRELAIDNSAFELSCTPGYYNNEGQGGAVKNGAFLGDFYSPGFYAFDELIAQWRAKGDLDGLELRD